MRIIPQTSEYRCHARLWAWCWGTERSETIRPRPQELCILAQEANNKPTDTCQGYQAGQCPGGKESRTKGRRRCFIGWPARCKAEFRREACDSDRALSSREHLEDENYITEIGEGCTNTQVNSGWGGTDYRSERAGQSVASIPLLQEGRGQLMWVNRGEVAFQGKGGQKTMVEKAKGGHMWEGSGSRVTVPMTGDTEKRP